MFRVCIILSETLNIIECFGKRSVLLFFSCVRALERTRTHKRNNEDEEQNHRVIMAGVSIIPRILLLARIRCPRRRVRPQGKVMLRLITRSFFPQ